MDIREAKEQIRRCIQIYLQKDAYGEYRIPVERQRPVFLLGAPGIGKTAIMEQISRETGLPLLAYSMTHHTRQSALGLPVITDRKYQGKSFSVSEYTLSEIISAIYTCMEKTGSREGILFLDEINCVSETLAPSMLQFLQYKTFGNHPIPQGWVIVTAGNPPQYNRAVREFDIVTMDRLKILQIEPDYKAWQSYAKEVGIHRAIQTFLDIRRDDFYRLENSSSGRQYVTARGWEDLSEAIILYEENGFPVDESLVSQYIRHRQVMEEFCTYYTLYCKYRGEYRIRQILDGTADQEMANRARGASLDERITVLELLLEALLPDIRRFMYRDAGLSRLQEILKPLKGEKEKLSERLKEEIRRLETEYERREEAGLMSQKEKEAVQFSLVFLRKQMNTLELEADSDRRDGFSVIREAFAVQVQEHEEQQTRMADCLKSLFSFAETCWGVGNEMLILVTELTADPGCMSYIYSYGCELYELYSAQVRLSDRKRELNRRIEDYTRSQVNGRD